MLETSDGAVGTLHLDYLRRDYKSGFTITGELGTIVGDLGKNGFFSLYDSAAEKWESVSFDTEKYDLNQMYKDEIQAFFKIKEDDYGLMQNYEESLELLLKVDQIKSLFNSSRSS